MSVESASFLSQLNPALPDGANPKSEGDDHLRLVKTVLQGTFPFFAGRINRVQTKTANYTLIPGDNGSVIMFTAGSTLLGDAGSAAATLGNGWQVVVYANGVDIAFDPNGAELVNGITPLTIKNGTAALIYCDGVGFHLFVLSKTALTVGAISGNTTLTVADLGSVKTVTAAADITLPAVSVALDGQAIRVKSSTTAQVRLLRAGSDTIDGATSYTLPAFAIAEIMRTAAGVWTLTVKPTHDIGNIIHHGVNSAPSGWVACDGSAISRATFGGLFGIIGTAFGVGDGSTTFNVPDFRRKVPVGAGGSGTGTLGNAVGNSGGEETHVLTVPETPAHTHTVTDPGHVHGAVGGADGLGALQDTIAASSSSFTKNTGSAVTGISIQNTGGGGAHNVMQPSLVVAYLIKA